MCISTTSSGIRHASRLTTQKYAADRGHVEARKVAIQSGGNTLVEQHPHSARRDPLLQKVLRHFERGHGLCALHTGKVDQELIERIASFEILQERLDRHPGPDEHEGPAHDLGVSMERKRGIGHSGSLAAYPKGIPGVGVGV